MTATNNDLVVCVCCSIVTLLVSILLILSSIAFSKENFSNKKIFSYISANSMVDGFQILLGTLSSVIFYLNCHPQGIYTQFAIKKLEFYVVICLGATLKTISDYLSASISIYRLIELSRFRQFNKRINVKYVFLWIICLSIITSSPVYTWKKISYKENNTFYEIQENSVNDYYSLSNIILYTRLAICSINFLMLIIPNIYFILVLKDLYKNRRHLLHLSSIQTHQLVSENETDQNTRSPTGCFRLLSITNKEIRMSLLIGSLSLVFTLDFISKYFFYFMLFRESLISSFIQKYRMIISSYTYCLIYLTNFFCYFCFCLEFRKNLKNIFMVFKCLCREN